MTSKLYVKRNRIILEDISCTDADGKVFEHHPTISFAKDVFKNGKGTEFAFETYEAAVHCEKQGLFNPSMALHCNFLEALYHRRADSAIEAVLRQYCNGKNPRAIINGCPHKANTVVNWGQQKVIHYPIDSDFPDLANPRGVNTSRSRVELPFERTGFEKDQPLVEALAVPNSARYLKDLTGLADLSILEEIARFVDGRQMDDGRIVHVYSSMSNDVCPVSIGCGYFNIGANGFLGDDDKGGGWFGVVRGAKEEVNGGK